MKVLVITTLPDPHFDMVVSHIPEATFLVVDPKTYLTDLRVTYSSGPALEQNYILVNNLRVEDVDIVWYRKPYFHTSVEMPVAEEYKVLIHDSYTSLVKWLYAVFPNAYWVSDPWFIFRANNKALQMQLAQSLGFQIPRTIVTNDSALAKDFLQECRQLVVKPLVQTNVVENGTVQVIFTNLITDRSQVTFEGLHISPMIFQEALFGIDVRVTVIGDKVFPCLISKSNAVGDVLDWRSIQEEALLSYTLDEDFPQELVDLCVEMVSELGLVFGAFDFIKVGNIYYFLEVNPNGQWGFVELEAGLPIAKAFAELFLSVC